MSTKDGGPAFPEACAVGPSGDVYEAHPGMSLRDWFAGQALTSIPGRQWEEAGRTDTEIIELWAKAAYATADAMLSARDVRGESG